MEPSSGRTYTQHKRLYSIPCSGDLLSLAFSVIYGSSLVLTFGILHMQAVPLKTASGHSTVSSSKASNEGSPPPEEEFEFSDVTTLMCILCARQFKSMDQLKRHNKESDLHKARKLLVATIF